MQMFATTNPKLDTESGVACTDSQHRAPPTPSTRMEYVNPIGAQDASGDDRGNDLPARKNASTTPDRKVQFALNDSGENKRPVLGDAESDSDDQGRDEDDEDAFDELALTPDGVDDGDGSDSSGDEEDVSKAVERVVGKKKSRFVDDEAEGPSGEDDDDDDDQDEEDEEDRAFINDEDDDDDEDSVDIIGDDDDDQDEENVESEKKKKKRKSSAKKPKAESPKKRKIHSSESAHKDRSNKAASKSDASKDAVVHSVELKFKDRDRLTDAASSQYQPSTKTPSEVVQTKLQAAAKLLLTAYDAPRNFCVLAIDSMGAPVACSANGFRPQQANAVPLTLVSRLATATRAHGASPAIMTDLMKPNGALLTGLQASEFHVAGWLTVMSTPDQQIAKLRDDLKTLKRYVLVGKHKKKGAVYVVAYASEMPGKGGCLLLPRSKSVAVTMDALYRLHAHPTITQSALMDNRNRGASETRSLFPDGVGVLQDPAVYDAIVKKEILSNKKRQEEASARDEEKRNESSDSDSDDEPPKEAKKKKKKQKPDSVLNTLRRKHDSNMEKQRGPKGQPASSEPPSNKSTADATTSGILKSSSSAAKTHKSENGVAASPQVPPVPQVSQVHTATGDRFAPLNPAMEAHLLSELSAMGSADVMKLTGRIDALTTQLVEDASLSRHMAVLSAQLKPADRLALQLLMSNKFRRAWAEAFAKSQHGQKAPAELDSLQSLLG